MPLSSPPMPATSLLVQGTTFTSQLWTSLSNLLGITLHQTTVYNTAASGMVERYYRTLKVALMSRCRDSNLFIQLPWVFLGLRTTPKDAMDVSASEMVYGDPLVVPAEVFASVTSPDNLHRICHIVGIFTPCRQTYKPPVKLHIPTDLHSAAHVFLRNHTSKPPLSPPYTNPFLVILCNPKAFVLNIRGKEDWVSIDCVKLADLLPDDPPTVCLSRSGRPI
ncbi:uncharacterized protein [Palaemon carinicauda]|uniref:uncharacterized protein n=1 Tax=Palaemon carinicauda TaxID=392227 RepID=UPI0035B5D5B1